MEYSKFQDGYKAGNSSLLQSNPIAIYASRHIPLSILLDAEKLLIKLVEENISLAGGWQSRTEKRLLKRACEKPKSKIVYFLAKGIDRFNPPSFLEPLLEQERLLILSPFKKQKRITKKLVEVRDQWMTKLINKYLFVYVDPDGKTPVLIKKLSNLDKKLYMLDHPQNTPFLDQLLIPINRFNFREVI